MSCLPRCDPTSSPRRSSSTTGGRSSTSSPTSTPWATPRRSPTSGPWPSRCSSTSFGPWPSCSPCVQASRSAASDTPPSPSPRSPPSRWRSSTTPEPIRAASTTERTRARFPCFSAPGLRLSPTRGSRRSHRGHGGTPRTNSTVRCPSISARARSTRSEPSALSACCCSSSSATATPPSPTAAASCSHRYSR